MYKIEWDKESGGVTLNTKITEGTIGIAPRPVFYEELDLLGLDALGYSYPRGKEPILWAVNKQYYYRGERLFDAKGADIYHKPTLVFASGEPQPCMLQAVDMALMLQRVNDLMFVLENEAIEFIRDTYTTYTRVNHTYTKAEANQIDFEALAAKATKLSKQKMAVVRQDCDSFDIVPLEVAESEGKRVLLTTKVDRFIASFSGGKDSQVVLDLCTRAIPPTAYEVIYSDTGYELPPSLELYQQTADHYQQHYPSLQFHLARNHESVLTYWDKIGTPSETHRWCCSIMKTAPLYRSLKIDGNKQAKVLTFEGVRAEESPKRTTYNRIGRGVKHSTTINARPIFYWSSIEIFLYLFKYNIPINPAYRVGKSRVGCIICPYSSPWDDMIVNEWYPKDLKPFIDRIQRSAKEAGVKDVDNYIEQRNWKFRASGNAIKNKTQVSFNTDKQKFVAIVFYPKQDLFSWLPIIGDVVINKVNENLCEGQIKYKKDVVNYEYQLSENKFVFSVFDIKGITLIGLLRRVVYKTAYCIHCETCEVECPSGALHVYPTISINKDKCVHCYKCLDFHDKGCIVANSLNMTNGCDIKAKSGIDRYSTFGLHDEWLDEFFHSPETYWTENSLGKKQVMGMKAWLKEAEIIDAKLQLTELGTILAKLYENNSIAVWEIILINLGYNSFIVNWVLNNIEFESLYDNTIIDESIKLQYGDAYGFKTIQNTRAAFIQLVKYSPIGADLLLGVDDLSKKRKRIAYNNISLEALTYSLYRYAEHHDLSMFKVSDLYRKEETNGVHREFGINKTDLFRKLRALSSDASRVIVAELTMGLEHITLRDDLNSIGALRTII